MGRAAPRSVGQSHAPGRTGPRLSTEVARLFPRQGQWTEADYFRLPETNLLVELSEGKLVIPDVPSDSHQFTSAEIYAALRAFVRPRGLGHLRFAPLRVRCGPERSASRISGF